MSDWVVISVELEGEEGEGIGYEMVFGGVGEGLLEGTLGFWGEGLGIKVWGCIV